MSHLLSDSTRLLQLSCVVVLLLLCAPNASAFRERLTAATTAADLFGYHFDLDDTGERLIVSQNTGEWWGAPHNTSLWPVEDGGYSVLESSAGGGWSVLAASSTLENRTQVGWGASIAGMGHAALAGSPHGWLVDDHDGFAGVIYPSASDPHEFLFGEHGSNEGMGWASSMSADGTHGVVCGPFHNGNRGRCLVLSIELAAAKPVMSVQQVILGTATRSYFGWSVAMSDDARTLVVCAPFHGVSGMCRIFDRADTSSLLSQSASISLPDLDESAEFGRSVSISASGSTIAVGSPGANGTAGSVSVFDKQDGSWAERVRFRNPSGASGDMVGKGVSLANDGNIIAMSSRVNGTGSVLVSRRNNNVSAWEDPVSLSVGTNVGAGWTMQNVRLSGSGAVLGVSAFWENGGKGAVYIGCPPGEYTIGIGVGCAPCPDGSICVASARFVCPAGTYSSNSTSNPQCVPCAPGTFSNSSATACEVCAAGRFSSASAATCELCPAGTFSPVPGATNSSVCQPCAAGRHSSALGASNSSACEICGPGRFSASRASECELCQAGRFSTVFGAVNASVCEPCAAGRHSAAVGATNYTACALCSAGTFAPAGAAVCENCTAGTFSPTIGATNSSTCRPCAAGRHSAVAGAINDTACALCGAGTFAPAGAAVCENCTAGTFSPTIGATNSTTCQPCAPGHHSPTFGATNYTACTLCSAGTFALSGAVVCDSCSAGTFSPTIGATNSTTCQPCAPGNFSSAGSRSCELCPAGKFQDSPSSTTCSVCPANTISTVPGSTGCTRCHPDMRAVPGSQTCIVCSDTVRDKPAPDGSRCVPRHSIGMAELPVIVVGGGLFVVVPAMLFKAGVSGADIFTFCLSAGDFTSDVFYVLTQPFVNEWLYYAAVGFALIPIIVTNIVHAPRLRGRTRSLLPLPDNSRIPFLRISFWHGLPAWSVRFLWNFNIDVNIFPCRFCQRPFDKDHRSRWLHFELANLVWTLIYIATWVAFTVLSTLARLFIALFLVVFVLVPMIIAMIVYGQFLLVTKLVTVRKAGGFWQRWWTSEAANPSMAAELFNKLVYCELIFESVPQIIIQAINNEGHWNWLAFVSIALSSFMILNTAYHVLAFRVDGFGWLDVPLLNEDYYPRVRRTASGRVILVPEVPVDANANAAAGPTGVEMGSV